MVGITRSKVICFFPGHCCICGLEIGLQSIWLIELPKLIDLFFKGPNWVCLEHVGKPDSMHWLITHNFPHVTTMATTGGQFPIFSHTQRSDFCLHSILFFHLSLSLSLVTYVYIYYIYNELIYII